MNTVQELRLDFTIPEFLRTVWASEQARDYWESKITRISANWQMVERLTLLHGMRQGILQSVIPEHIPQLQAWARENDTPMVILGLEGSSGGYGNATKPYEQGKPFTYRIYLGSEPDEFLTAWKAEDDLAIGHMLDYPVCCTKFFKKYWKDEGWRDLTYHTFDMPIQRNMVFNNVLLRHIGIRGVFHLPCSVTCESSVRMGLQIAEVMRVTGDDRDVEWWTELLSMPMQWDSLHGVAMVTTPILKTIYASDALGEKVVLKLESDRYPRAGASGNQFPFTMVQHVRLTRDANGFKSWEAMRDAHRFILSCIPKDLKGKVLDLGCGNGQLLKEIHKEHPSTFLIGVEANSAIIDRAVQGATYWNIDIYDLRAWVEVDLALMAVQRLYEAPEHKAHALMEVLSVYSEQVLLYSYDGWFEDVDKFIEPYFNIVTATKDLNQKALLLERKS